MSCPHGCPDGCYEPTGGTVTEGAVTEDPELQDAAEVTEATEPAGLTPGGRPI